MSKTRQLEREDFDVSRFVVARLMRQMGLEGAVRNKPNTLAHRVAYLIVNGADPRRILLMTFKRRAANYPIRSKDRERVHASA